MYDIILKALWIFEIVGELMRMSYQTLIALIKKNVIFFLNTQFSIAWQPPKKAVSF